VLAATHSLVLHFVASLQLALTLTANGRVMPLQDMLVPVKVTVLTCSEKPICGGMMPVTSLLLLKSAASSAYVNLRWNSSSSSSSDRCYAKVNMRRLTPFVNCCKVYM
jgi:hypothetical protein